MNIYIRILFYLFAYLSFFTAVLYVLSYTVYKKKLKVEKWNKPLPVISIIIPAYNEEKAIEKTIESILNLNYPKDKLDIIVIDDGSNDKTYLLAYKYLKNIRLFKKENGGKASALNLGIKKAKGEFVITMDADSFVLENSITGLLGYFKEKKVACTTSSMLIHNPKGFFLKMQSMEYVMGIFLRKAFSLIDSVHVTPGPFSMYRKSFFDKHGGFDEKTITEDTEMALRIQSKGYKIRASFESIVYTIAPNNFLDLYYQRRRWYTGYVQNIMKYKHLFHKNYGELGILILPLSLASIVSSAIITIYYLSTSINTILDFLKFQKSVGYDLIGSLNVNSSIVKLIILQTLSEPLFMVGLFGTIFFIYMLMVVRKQTNQKFEIIISAPIFIIFYIILFAFWWTMSIFNVIFLKSQRWRR